MLGDSCRKPIVVIEHCEPELSPWLILEYRHASMIYGRDCLWFTNVPARFHRVLGRYGHVMRESIVELAWRNTVNPADIVVLDPKAPKQLSYGDLETARYLVVGGILGDYPPRGRTWLFITSRMPENVRARNIGEGQYSIDGAVFYVNYMWENKGLEGFRYVDGVVIEAEHGSVYLPYRYPVVGDKPLLADGLEYYLKYRRIRDDIWKEISGKLE